jgi:alginate O-acetyltransferase complex protein AlgI
MLFNSPEFLFKFLPIAFVGYLLLLRVSTPLTKIWVVVASLVFYAWFEPWHLIWLTISLVVNCGLSLPLSRLRPGKGKQLVLWIGITFNLGMLFHFKYSEFAGSIFGGRFDQGEALASATLPLAISFVTFTQIAYLVDVYRTETYRSSPLDYGFFALFFPHLIAGPILRHEEFGPQIRNRLPMPGLNDVLLGAFWLTAGLTKKMLLADNAAPYANAVFGDPALIGNLTMLQAWTGTLAFAVQIYFDFSGYSDMAIGLARMFGLHFPLNFDVPYQAVSLQEFWSRWHMTLSRFLRDYLYIPLGGNRKGATRQMLNLLLTMIVSGIWHGAGWTFIAWGALHGVFLTLTHLWRQMLSFMGIRKLNAAFRLCGWALTFVFVIATWAYFRASSLGDAHAVLAAMFGAKGWHAAGPQSLEDFVYVALLMLVAILLPPTHRILPNLEEWPAESKGWVAARIRALGTPAAGLATGILFFLVVKSFFSSQPSQFIYFKF